MPKPKNGAPKESDFNEEPIASDFSVHHVPSEKEVVKIEKNIEREIKDAEIDESLSEIYQDETGKLVDVSHLNVKKRGFFSRLFLFLVFVLIVGSAGYVGYKYIYLGNSNASSSVDFSIDGNEEVTAGEEYFYTINYKNTGKIPLDNLVINLKYPDNFVLLDADDKSSKGTWNIDEISPGYSGLIKIKGKMVAPQDFSAIALGSIAYKPANFNSEFKKESSFVTLVKNIGMDVNFDYASPMLVGDKDDLNITIKPADPNFIKNLRIDIDPLENIEFQKLPDSDLAVKQIRPGVYDAVLNTQDATSTVVTIPIKFLKKINDVENLKVRFSEIEEDGSAKEFYNHALAIDVIKSDLNLSLIINGSRSDNGVDFGGLMNYSIVFANKGTTELKDLVIMSVMNSEFLNWSTLSDKNNGQTGNNAITWSKSEIPQLASLQPGQEGTIDFSIEVATPQEFSPDKKYMIDSYAQYSIGTTTNSKNPTNFRSNEIITGINSDLNLKESVKYFNDDNIAVGSGPLPLKVGETTGFKVYWEVANKLHELNNLKVTTKLPDYVTYAGQENIMMGKINFDQTTHILTWDIGRLPLTVQNVTADFNVSLKPVATDAGKILVILNEADIEATDAATNVSIAKKVMPKTTRLEDDSIANTDGIVAN